VSAPPAYDAYADWYEEYLSTAAAPHVLRVQSMVAELLGPGTGTCLDVCRGTGAHAAALAGLGWTPVGVDLSAAQLRHAGRRLPVAVADVTALPVADAAVPAVACVLASTDVPDYAAAVREIARVLAPGGRFLHVGVHPCFVGAFADWSGRPAVVVDERYADRSHSFEAWTPDGVRARVGAWHLPLADLLNAMTAAGLVPERVAESSTTGIPDLLGLRAIKP